MTQWLIYKEGKCYALAPSLDLAKDYAEELDAYYINVEDITGGKRG